MARQAQTAAGGGVHSGPVEGLSGQEWFDRRTQKASAVFDLERHRVERFHRPKATKVLAPDLHRVYDLIFQGDMANFEAALAGLARRAGGSSSSSSAPPRSPLASLLSQPNHRGQTALAVCREALELCEGVVHALSSPAPKDESESSEHNSDESEELPARAASDDALSAAPSSTQGNQHDFAVPAARTGAVQKLEGLKVIEAVLMSIGVAAVPPPPSPPSPSQRVLRAGARLVRQAQAVLNRPVDRTVMFPERERRRLKTALDYEADAARVAESDPDCVGDVDVWEGIRTLAVSLVLGACLVAAALMTIRFVVVPAADWLGGSPGVGVAPPHQWISATRQAMSQNAEAADAAKPEQVAVREGLVSDILGNGRAARNAADAAAAGATATVKAVMGQQEL